MEEEKNPIGDWLPNAEDEDTLHGVTKVDATMGRGTGEGPPDHRSNDEQSTTWKRGGGGGASADHPLRPDGGGGGGVERCPEV